MSGQLEELQRRIGAIGELHEIVGAMRALAAMRLDQAVTGLAAARAYADTVSRALGMALGTDGGVPWAAPPRAPRGLVVFGPEHGLCGALARHLIEAAAAEANGAQLFLVGSRALMFAEELSLAVAWQAPMATQPAAAVATAREVCAELHRRLDGGALGGVDLLFACHQGGGRSGIAHRRLLPIDARAHRARAVGPPPLTGMPPAELVPRLVEEHLFAELAHAVVESLAAENGARLAAMQATRRNIEERLAELRRAERRARQSSVTEEIADLAAGVAALERR